MKTLDLEQQENAGRIDRTSITQRKVIPKESYAPAPQRSQREQPPAAYGSQRPLY